MYYKINYIKLCFTCFIYKSINIYFPHIKVISKANFVLYIYFLNKYIYLCVYNINKVYKVNKKSLAAVLQSKHMKNIFGQDFDTNTPLCVG